MATRDQHALDLKAPPFDQFTAVRRLATPRSGRDSDAHARHHLYTGQERPSGAHALIKITAKPGLVYERNLANEIASLATINRSLPASPYFPVAKEHGRLRDGRIYVITPLFDELPLAATISAEPVPGKLVGNLLTALEVATALIELHRLGIVHVDLNPMNILYRAEHGRPVIKIVDFESSYEEARYSNGEFYDPPTTPGYSAPEVSNRHPDARADVFSLGAVLYTMLAGFEWTWRAEVGACVEADRELDAPIRSVLLSATHADPGRRQHSMTALRAALAGYLEAIWPGRLSAQAERPGR